MAICLIDAAVMLSAWLGLGSSDPAGNAIMAGLTMFLAMVFAVTTIPALALALIGRLPRTALALAVAFLLFRLAP